MVDCNCTVCGSVFYVSPAHLKRGDGIFCSKECYSKYHNILLICANCGKNFRRRKSTLINDRQFCSIECVGEYYSGSASPFWKGGMKARTCSHCKRKFFVRKYKIGLDLGKFCSRKCMGKYNSIHFSGKNSFNYRLGHPPLENKCEFCGRLYYIYKSQNGRSKFCSKKCHTIHTIMNMPRKETNIEKIVREWLENAGVPHKKQVPLLKSTIADFFIEPNIAVYCDGLYWHSRRDHVIGDRRINKTLKENNYIVLRLKEKEILNGSGRDRLLEIAKDGMSGKPR